MNWEAFFTLHQDLPREGPGSRADLDWACKRAELRSDAKILDAGCGPGADIDGLLAHAPDGHVTAVDAHGPFVAQARAMHGDDPRVTFITGDMAKVEGPFDFIWCAGALYFLGLENGLEVMAEKLAPGGTIAFSHLLFIVAHPDPELRDILKAEVPDIAGPAELKTRIKAAGFDLMGARTLPNSSWDAYYGPMAERIAKLRPGADAELTQILDNNEAEMGLRARFPNQFSYSLSLVRPA